MIVNAQKHNGYNLSENGIHELFYGLLKRIREVEYPQTKKQS